MTDVPFLGHGPPKVSDNLALWLVAEEAPDAVLAAKLSATLPADLRDWALEKERADGSVDWHDSVLYVDSGMDVRYLVNTLDPEHLAWLPEEISDADVERILDEVMDGERKGPKAPSASDWDLFGAMIAQWVEAVHQRCPLWLVVVDRKVKPPGNARHRGAAAWVRDHLDEIASRHDALCKTNDRRPYGAVGWGAPVVAAYLSVIAKPDETTREVLLQLLNGSGMQGLALGSKLMGMWPKSQRPGVLVRLLQQGHDLGLPLLAAPASHRFLLDDEVYAAAMTPMRRMFPGDMTQVVNKRMMKPKMGDQQSEWLRRMLVVAEVDGTMQRLADEEPPEQLSHKTRLRWWLALADQLED